MSPLVYETGSSRSVRVLVGEPRFGTLLRSDFLTNMLFGVAFFRFRVHDSHLGVSRAERCMSSGKARTFDPKLFLAQTGLRRIILQYPKNKVIFRARRT
jgi:hypothetical protein